MLEIESIKYGLYYLAFLFAAGILWFTVSRETIVFDFGAGLIFIAAFFIERETLLFNLLCYGGLALTAVEVFILSPNRRKKSNSPPDSD